MARAKKSVYAQMENYRQILFSGKQCFKITYKLFLQKIAVVFIPSWNKKNKKCLDEVCIIVYICVCSEGVFPS